MSPRIQTRVVVTHTSRTIIPKSGAVQFRSGPPQFRSGAPQLRSGAPQLRSGAPQLRSGAPQLRSGAVGSRRIAGITKKGIRVFKRPGISRTTRKDKKIQKKKQIRARDRRKAKIRVKTWLETPADWARFDAWAKIKAQPRKYPEPEPIIRPSKSLHLLKRRIILLSKLPKRGDPSKQCKPIETKVSKAALNAIITKRLLLLSIPKLHICEYGRKLPIKISKATLSYIPTKRINSLSQPRIIEREECKPIAILENTKDKLRKKKRLLELTKKLAECPEGLTDEERKELFTTAGIRKSALKYKISTWTEILALPGYIILRPRYDPDAKKWKKTFLQHFEIRGKKALEEQRSRIKWKKKKKKGDMRPEKGEGNEIKPVDEKEKDSEDKKKKDEAEKKRKRTKHAWRYAPLPYKTYKDAFLVKKSALNVEASPRTTELAKSRDRKEVTIKKKPFDVKKGALNATSTGRINELALPKQPRDPVEKVPPREKNKYGRSIYPKPKYGKVLPKTKPYKMGECPKEEDKKETKKKKERPIDPIVYQPTIDPCIDPEMAKKQMTERKRAEEILKRKRQEKKSEEEEKVENKEIEEEKEEEN